MVDADPKFMEKCSREIRQFKCDKAESFEDTVECLRINYDGLGMDSFTKNSYSRLKEKFRTRVQVDGVLS